MKIFFDLFPLAIFLIVYKLNGLHVAIVATVIATLIQIGFNYYKTKKFEPMHLLTLGILTSSALLTFIFKNDAIFKWKPTVLNWTFASILIASDFFSSKTILQRIMGQQFKLPAHAWVKLSISWAIFFIICGFLNLYFAFYYGLGEMDEQSRTDVWVNFKVFGLLGLTLVFVIGQSLFLYKHIEKNATDKDQASS